ncbi:hypothetical protein QFZ31_006711 [Neobacillus niacini]|nr:hypothetical protein [Neobacillus niacini]
MGFLELLTLIFIVLKLVGIVSFSWFYVFLPLIISVSLYVLWFIVWVILAIFINR